MNKPCEHYREEKQLLYHYGELAADQRLQLEDHLANCLSCRKAWQDLQRSLEKIPQVSMDWTTAEARRFAARVARKAGHSRQGFRMRLWGGALVASLLVIATFSIFPSGFSPVDNPKVVADAAMVQDLGLLQNLDLLEQLDLLQELDGQG